MYIDVVTLLSVLALVVLAGVRNIACYICSNWTKVALVCRYANNASWQQSPAMNRCIARVLRCRCKLLNHWEGKMNHCSVLMLRPRRTPLALLRCLIPMLPDQKTEVPRAVKAAILHALRSYDEGSRSNGVVSLPSNLQLQVGGNHIWDFDGTKGTANTMLVCHIATSILELRSETSRFLSDHKIAATHLSCYCAYLVAHTPELLPEDDGWCRSLYKAVKKDADRVLVGGAAPATPEDECEKLVQLLRTRSKHQVLKDGAELRKRLAEGEEAAAWSVLAGFWSEMILYVAPSDNLDGHADAIARGGELITLLWPLLARIGIARWADDPAGAAL